MSDRTPRVAALTLALCCLHGAAARAEEAPAVDWDSLSSIALDPAELDIDSPWELELALRGDAALRERLTEGDETIGNALRSRAAIAREDSFGDRLSTRVELVLEHDRPIEEAATEDEALELRLGESFVQLDRGEAGWVRAGNLLVPFGTAEAFRVLDVFNPRDDRFWAVDGFDGETLATPALQLVRSFGATRAQLLVGLDFVPDRVGGEGDDFDPFVLDRASMNVRDATDVDDFVPEWLLSVQYFGQGFDLTLLGGEVYAKSPSLRARDDAAGPPELETSYPREAMIGLSGALVSGSWLLRSDVGFFADRQHFRNAYFGELALGDPAPRSVLPSDVIETVLGVEYTGLSGTQLSIEYLFSRSLDWQEGMRGEPRSESFALNVSRSFLSSRLELTARAISIADHAGRILQLAADYALGDRTSVGMQLLSYDAESGSFFEPYRDNDRALLQLKLSY